MRVQVTGGAGFIGSAFVRCTLAQYPNDEVVVLDKLTYAVNLANLEWVERDWRYRCVQGDVADAELMASLLTEIDAVVNLPPRRTSIGASWMLANS